MDLQDFARNWPLDLPHLHMHMQERGVGKEKERSQTGVLHSRHGRAETETHAPLSQGLCEGCSLLLVPCLLIPRPQSSYFPPSALGSISHNCHLITPVGEPRTATQAPGCRLWEQSSYLPGDCAAPESSQSHSSATREAPTSQWINHKAPQEQ